MNCNWGAIANYTWSQVSAYTWDDLTICQKVKTLSSSATLSAAIPRSTLRTIAAACIVSASIVYQLIKTVIEKTLSATATVASAVTRSTGKLHTVSVSLVSAMQKHTSQTLSQTVNAVGSHLKQVGKGIVSNVILTPLKSAYIFRVLSATVNITSTVRRFMPKLLTATVNASATARRAITQNLTAVINTANAVLQQTTKTFVATVNTASSLTRRWYKTLSATIGVASSFIITTANILWEKTLTASVSIVYTTLPRTWGDLYASTWNDLTAYEWGDLLLRGGTHIVRQTNKNNLDANIATTSFLVRQVFKTVVAIVAITSTLVYLYGKRLVDKTTYVVTHNFRIVLTAVKAGARALYATHSITETIHAVKSITHRLNCVHTFRLEVTWRMGADPRGETIRMVLGETKIIELFVEDEDGAAADLTGATAILAIEGGIEKACTVDGNKITVTIDPDDIEKVGSFGYEFRIQDALLQVDSLVIGKIKVDPKLTTTF